MVDSFKGLFIPTNDGRQGGKIGWNGLALELGELDNFFYEPF